ERSFEAGTGRLQRRCGRVGQRQNSSVGLERVGAPLCEVVDLAEPREREPGKEVRLDEIELQQPLEARQCLLGSLGSQEQVRLVVPGLRQVELGEALEKRLDVGRVAPHGYVEQGALTPLLAGIDLLEIDQVRVPLEYRDQHGNLVNLGEEC